MNKLAAAIILASIFISCSSVVYGAAMSNEETTYKTNELSSKLDEVKKKKDKITLREEYAEMFFQNEAYAAAAVVYSALLEMKPSKKKKAEYYIKLGDMEAIQKSYNESLAYYENALSLYKNNSDIKRKIGDILLQSNLYGLAEERFKDIIKSDKNSDYAKKKLGDIYYRQKKYSKALEYYESISPLHYDKEIIANFTDCYKSLNNYDKAVKLVNDFLGEHDDSDIYLLSGFLYAGIGDIAKAEERFISALQLNETNFAAYIHLAAIYLNNNDIKKSEEMLNKAGIINSYTAVVDMLHARISYRKGRLYEARRYAANAVLKAKTPFLKQQSQRMLDFFNEKK
ncbi:MAG: tetratricopeptide repeat protein [Endomicrobium sp.]|nr:tetratricopeptide repeat protein [Endomicrobium sp.]